MWNPAKGKPRDGVATLWIILCLPILILFVLYAVEAGRIQLARQQLVTSLESSALAAVKTCALGDSTDTLAARQNAVDFAAANLVLGSPSRIDPNWNPANTPTENADCEGDVVLGSLVEIRTPTELHARYLGGCGRKDGPNAVALMATSTMDWQTVSLCGRNYNAMIVVGSPNYDQFDPPLVVRVRTVSANSFEFFVQNVNTNAAVAGIDVHFLVVEAGVYTIAAHGLKMEARLYNSTVTDDNNRWVGQNQGYANAYANPVVVGQVMSYNDPDWSVFWSHNGNRPNAADSAGLWTGKHVGEDPDNTRLDELIGYIVFEQGAGNLNGLPYYAGDTQQTVQSVGNNPPYTYAVPNPSAGTFAIASQTGMRGGNGSWAHLHGPDPVDPGLIALALDEDQLADVERNHITEHVHYVTFAGPCAVRVQSQQEIPWYFSNLFGSVLANPTVRGQAVAYFDCVDDRSKLICLDRFVCP